MSWKTSEPPKDGTPIVAVGRIIYSDEFSTTVEPFTATIYWNKTKSDYEGWMFWCGGLSVQRELDDEVKIDFWIERPTEPVDCAVGASERQVAA